MNGDEPPPQRAPASESGHPPDAHGGLPPAVLLMYDIVDSLERGEARDMATEEHTVETARAVEQALSQSLAFRLEVVPVRTEAEVRSVAAEAASEGTLVFNLCEALGGLSSGEAVVPEILDELGCRYLGASGANVRTCLDKGAIKRLLCEASVATAEFQVFTTGDEDISVPFPLIVKPLTEHCSVGITPDSVVADKQSLRNQIAYVHQVYRQPALAEAFLPGREFSVSVWGNWPGEVLGVSEVDYSSCRDERLRFRHFDVKWQDTLPIDFPAKVDPELMERLTSTALAAYRVAGCRDYARIDIRERSRIPHVIDVNPNPSLGPDDGFAWAAAAAGMNYVEMLLRLVRLGWARCSAARHPIADKQPRETR